MRKPHRQNNPQESEIDTHWLLKMNDLRKIKFKRNCNKVFDECEEFLRKEETMVKSVVVKVMIVDFDLGE